MSKCDLCPKGTFVPFAGFSTEEDCLPCTSDPVGTQRKVRRSAPSAPRALLLTSRPIQLQDHRWGGLHPHRGRERL